MIDFGVCNVLIEQNEIPETNVSARNQRKAKAEADLVSIANLDEHDATHSSGGCEYAEGAFQYSISSPR